MHLKGIKFRGYTKIDDFRTKVQASCFDYRTFNFIRMQKLVLKE